MHGPIRSLGLIVALALLGGPAVASGQTVQYAYVAAGRLSVVADPRGDLAVYQYDAVGNLLSIRRIDVGEVPDAVVIAYVTPEVGSPGSIVSIFGKGFGATADANVVAFNDAETAVLAASPTRLIVRVPPEATTGPIRVATPLGVATSAPFRVLGALRIIPATAVVAPRGTVRFTVAGDAAVGVRWSVDRIVGGDSQHGTISAEGVYVAPATPPPGGVDVTAASLVDAAAEATAHVSIVAARPLSVTARPLAVVIAAPMATLAAAAPVALRIAPVILGISPSSAARGETVRLVIVGTAFEGATGLELRTAAGPDTTLVARDLVIAAEGHEASADVTIPLDAPIGPRVVRIVTPLGSSAGAVHAENVFLVR
jgi:hypothetical protein